MLLGTCNGENDELGLEYTWRSPKQAGAFQERLHIECGCWPLLF